MESMTLPRGREAVLDATHRDRCPAVLEWQQNRVQLTQCCYHCPPGMERFCSSQSPCWRQIASIQECKIGSSSAGCGCHQGDGMFERAGGGIRKRVRGRVRYRQYLQCEKSENWDQKYRSRRRS